MCILYYVQSTDVRIGVRQIEIGFIVLDFRFKLYYCTFFFHFFSCTDRHHSDIKCPIFSFSYTFFIFSYDSKFLIMYTIIIFLYTDSYGNTSNNQVFFSWTTKVFSLKHILTTFFYKLYQHLQEIDTTCLILLIRVLVIQRSIWPVLRYVTRWYWHNIITKR